MALFALGASNIIYDGSIVDTEQLLDCADRQGATNLFLPGSTIEHVARTDCGVDKIRQSRIRMIVAHGAVSPEAVIELDSALPGVSILRSWGVNELPWPATVLPSALARVQPDSVGVAMSHCRIAVKSPDGDISGDGTGELLIRSRARMRGYLPAQADHRERETSSGWLNTGRVGTVDKLGCVYLNENGFS
jgi:long-subunit acyl-CoA synthetase (AMP-forming)